MIIFIEKWLHISIGNRSNLASTFVDSPLRVILMSFPLDIREYQLLECIGIGSTSQVYRARCHSNGQVIAIKKIDLELYPLEIEVLRREVAFWSRCQNESIVGYYGSFIDGSVLYMLMEYLSGGSVLDIMREICHGGGFNDEVLLATIMKGIVVALNFVHGHDEIHRDVKPGNILLGADGAVKIGDFGVAASMLEQGRKRARFTVIGTLNYMAPEVINEEIPYTQSADIWSLGITAYELALGNSPYYNLQPLRIIPQILNSPPPRLPNDGRFSQELRDFVRICLNHQTANRPSASNLLQHPFIQKARDGNYIVENLLSKIPPLELRSRRKKNIYDELIPKPSVNNQEQPTWQFPTDDANFSQNAMDQKTQNNVSEQQQIFQLFQQQPHQPSPTSSIEHKGRFNIQITKQNSHNSLLEHSQSANLLPASSPLEHENAEQARQKDLTAQIADLSAKVEQLTRENEQFRNQLKVLRGRIEMIAKTKK